MKRIIFEKLTVRETAHIHGASLNVSNIQSTLFNEEACDTPPDPDGETACQLATDSIIDCEEPGVPTSQCTSPQLPSHSCVVTSV